MRLAIHSHSASARAGGGVLYVYSLAAVLAAEHAVDLYYPSTVDPAELEQVLPLFDHRPTIRRDRSPLRPVYWRELYRLGRDLRYDATIIQSLVVPRFNLLRRSVLLCEFPVTRELRPGERARLKTFRTVVANSHYTARWIERRWGRRARVLHPPVQPIAPGAKEPIILGVGRFADGGRSKRQLELVRFFRRLHDGGLRGWELHLAGFPHDPAYVERIQREAAGLPVRLWLDLDREALEKLYGRASIFWHAVGLGADVEREPERMEHFGIVTIEAMSAGAVPVVIDRGGQPEILGDPPCGVLWSEADECLDATRRLIDDEHGRERLAARARERARRFSFAAFAERARRIFEPLEHRP